MNINKLENFCQSFIFNNLHVRGHIVRLTDVYQSISEVQEVSGCSAQLLGQVLAAAAMLIQPLKTASDLTIQFQSENEIKLLAVKVDTDGHMRAIITLNKQPKFALIGEGFLVVTVMQHNTTNHHQSVIDVHKGQAISQALAKYFTQSEQLPSLFYFAYTEDTVSGIMIQQDSEMVSEEDWNTLSHLFCSVSDQELLNLDSETIIHRLFNEFSINIFPAKDLTFKCNCSLEKMQSAIMSIGEQDAKDMLQTNRVIEVSCEYCKNHYGFDKNDIQIIFNKH